MSTETCFTLSFNGRRFAAGHDAILALLESMKLEPVAEPVAVAEPEPEQEPEQVVAPKPWTWKERVAKMSGKPVRADYGSKREWTIAYAMWKYYTQPQERDRINVAKEVARLRKRADELAAGQVAKIGRPAKVYNTPCPEDK